MDGMSDADHFDFRSTKEIFGKGRCDRYFHHFRSGHDRCVACGAEMDARETTDAEHVQRHAVERFMSAGLTPQSRFYAVLSMLWTLGAEGNAYSRPHIVLFIVRSWIAMWWKGMR